MNKKVWISVLLVVVLFVGGLLGFVIIPNAVNAFKPAAGNPTTRDSVSGNGGNAVMVGEYLYFINGFKSKAAGSLNYKDNEYNKVKTEGAIYRVKMENGEPQYDNSYLDYLSDWSEYGQYDKMDPRQKVSYSTAMDKRIASDATKKTKDTNLQLIAPKLAGWENSALWIFGNDLVYTSPNNQKDKTGQLQRDKIDFFRCDLNGANNRKIYTTTSTTVGTNGMTVVNVGGKTYLLVNDGDSKLVRVDMKGKVSTISTTMDSFAFPMVSSYYKGYDLTSNGDGTQTLTLADDKASLANSYSGIMGYVFYTEKRADDDTFRGNVLKRYNIATGENVKILQDNDTQKMLSLGNGGLLFTTTFEATDKIAGKTGFYVVRNADATSFDLTYLNTNCRMSLPMDSSDTVYLSGERTDTSAFRYITATGGQLFVYDTNQNSSYVPYQIPGITDVGSVLYVGSGCILYTSTSGTSRCIDFAGKVQMDVYATSDVSTRVTVFQDLNKYGQPSGRGYMFFYVKSLTEVIDDSTTSTSADSTDTTSTDLAKITVGAIIGQDGRENLLARLDDKFIQLPKDSTDTTNS